MFSLTEGTLYYELGMFYADGRGVAKNRAEAVKWFRKSAESGFTPAEDMLKKRFDGGK